MPGNGLLPPAALAGFALGLSLVFSLGPQNLRLIRAGIANSHPLTVVTTGYVSEILIVAAGFFWVGTALAAAPALVLALRLLGIGFLVVCAVKAFRRRQSATAIADGPPPREETRGWAVIAMLAVTWLNPLAYLEVLFLVGILSYGFAGGERLLFTAGFLLASAIKFFGWSFVGRAATSWLVGPRREAQLDAIGGTSMLAVGALLTVQTVPLLIR